MDCTRVRSPDQLGPDVPGDQGAGGEQGAVRAAHHGRRDDAHPDPGDGGRREVLEAQREDELGGGGVRSPVALTIPGDPPVCVPGHGAKHEGGDTEGQRDQRASVGQNDGPEHKCDKVQAEYYLMSSPHPCLGGEDSLEVRLPRDATEQTQQSRV